MAAIAKEGARPSAGPMEGIPRFNVAAFLLPPIWGPAHGLWVTILYYPAWLFADNMLYAAWESPTPLSVALAALLVAILLAVTIAFAILSQPYAARRAASMGISRETYLRRQRWWAAGCAIGAVAMLALATVYNLEVRPGLGG